MKDLAYEIYLLSTFKVHLFFTKRFILMTDTILFKESQRFKQILLWVLLISIFVFVSIPAIYGLIKQLFWGEPFGNRPMSNEGLIVVTTVSVLIPFFIIILFGIMKLETVIKSDGIYVRFFPFHTKYKYFSLAELNKCYVRKYSAVGEYGGWGMKGWGNNKSLSVSGDQGIQLEIKEGKKLLIGTHDSDEVSKVLLQLGCWKE